MHVRPSRRFVWLAVTVALLMLCVSGTPGVSASSQPSAMVAGSPWAYGTLHTVDFSGSNSSAGFGYRGTVLYGFSVILNESLPSNGTFTLSVTRDMGVQLSIEYCLPDCTNPTLTATLTYRAWELSTASTNLTTDAAVTEGVLSVPALGLENSSASLSAGIRAMIVYATPSATLWTRTFSLNASGWAKVQLDPALGLIPLNLTPGTAWNSTGAFSAVGAYSWSWIATKLVSSIGVPVVVSNAGNGSANGTGALNVLGEYAAGSTVTLDGQTYAAVNLTVLGPFAVREGLVLLPAGADLFGGGATNWSAHQGGSAAVSDTHLDLGSSFASGRLGLVASSALWRASASESTVVSVGGTSPPGPVPSAMPAAPAGGSATYVQGQPESVAQAQGDQQCLTEDTACPASLGPGAHGWFGLLVIGAVGSLAAAAVATTTYNRRRVPPPVYPNAGLYPPGAPFAAAPAPPVPAPEAPPPEEDPLGHLW
jgi:hypothetical protein